MNKKKSTLTNNIASFFTTHPWLKFIALLLAIIVWFYIKDEIIRFNY